LEFPVILSALLAATLMLAETTPAAATAATPATPASAAAPAKPQEEGRLVCHSESQPGTLMTKKVCTRVADPHKQADQQPAKPVREGAN
jgi:invasion protein IalB